MDCGQLRGPKLGVGQWGSNTPGLQEVGSEFSEGAAAEGCIIWEGNVLLGLERWLGEKGED